MLTLLSGGAYGREVSMLVMSIWSSRGCCTAGKSPGSGGTPTRRRHRSGSRCSCGWRGSCEQQTQSRAPNHILNVRQLARLEVGKGELDASVGLIDPITGSHGAGDQEGHAREYARLHYGVLNKYFVDFQAWSEDPNSICSSTTYWKQEHDNHIY
jgi:hypothetical protein